MLNKIFGGIGILLGGMILSNWLLSTGGNLANVYQAGQMGPIVGGALMFVVGLYFFFKKPTSKNTDNGEEVS